MYPCWSTGSATTLRSRIAGILSSEDFRILPLAPSSSRTGWWYRHWKEPSCGRHCPRLHPRRRPWPLPYRRRPDQLAGSRSPPGGRAGSSIGSPGSTSSFSTSLAICRSPNPADSSSSTWSAGSGSERRGLMMQSQTLGRQDGGHRGCVAPPRQGVEGDSQRYLPMKYEVATLPIFVTAKRARLSS